MQSPLSGNDHVKLIREYKSGDIVASYKAQLGIDVSTYFINIPIVSLFECVDSGYRFYYPFSLEGDKNFYELLSTSPIEYYPGWKWENVKAALHIPSHASIMDVGCGDGTFLANIKMEKSADCFGIEFNPDAIRKAEQKGLRIYSDDPLKIAKENEGRFDVVTSFQVLEHICKVRDFLENKVHMAKQGGLIIIGVPYNNPYLYKLDVHHILNLPPHHMGLWNEISLQNLENYLPVKMEKFYIEPLDDLSYYAFVQFRMISFYKFLYRYKIFRGGFRAVNRLLSSFQKKIRGRNILIVFKKL